MKRVAVLLPVLALALGGACTNSSGPGAGLTANRMKWDANKPAEYTYQLQISCFCLRELVEPVRISVQGETVESVVSVATGEPLTPEHAAYFQITIDSLFNWVAEAAGGAADEVTAAYDPALGYPRDVRIDYLREAIDDEMAFTAELLAP